MKNTASAAGMFLIAMALFTAGAFAYDCWDGAYGASYWWTHNDSAAPLIDVCGNENGTETGAPTYGLTGVFDDAINYTGTDLFTVANDDWFNSSADYSWCFWQKTATSNTDANVDWIIRKVQANEYAISCYQTGSGQNHLSCSIYDNPTLATVVYTTAINDNQWRHFCFLRDNTGGKIYLYVNGSYYTNATAAGLNVFTNTATTIGAYAVAGYYYRGMLDEVNFFNYTLNSTAISNIFNYNQLAAGCTVDFTPTAAAINESQAFTGTKGAGCGAWDGTYWWNFTRWADSTEYFSPTTNPASVTLNYTGDWEVTFTATIGGINYTKTQNVTVAERPDANFTVTTTAPLMAGDSIQFNDTSTDPGGFTPFTNWYWDFGEGNTSTTQNATNTFILPGEYEVGLIVTSSIGLNSTEYTDNVTINGFALAVYDEKTGVAITNWNATISNSTYSVTFTDQNNTFSWYNFTDFPTGTIEISLSASGYVPRNYYGYYGVSYYIDLDAYLLDTSNGIYPIFNVVDTSYSPLEDALISAYRDVAGTSTLVSQMYTDTVGAAQMYLDPTATHTIITTKSGYNPDSSDITPTASNYLIILTQNATYNYFNISDTFFIVVQPHDTDLEVGVDNITVTIHDPYNNLNYWNITVVNQTYNPCYSYNGSTSSGGIHEFNTSSFSCTVAAGTRVYARVYFDRNTSSPYNFTEGWWNLGGYDTLSLANVFGTITISDDFKAFVAVAATTIVGLLLGSPLGAGIGAIAMIGTAVVFASYSWINAMWVAMAILMGLGAYVYSVRGGGAVA